MREREQGALEHHNYHAFIIEGFSIFTSGFGHYLHCLSVKHTASLLRLSCSRRRAISLCWSRAFCAAEEAGGGAWDWLDGACGEWVGGVEAGGVGASGDCCSWRRRASSWARRACSKESSSSRLPESKKQSVTGWSTNIGLIRQQASFCYNFPLVSLGLLSLCFTDPERKPVKNDEGGNRVTVEKIKVLVSYSSLLWWHAVFLSYFSYPLHISGGKFKTYEQWEATVQHPGTNSKVVLWLRALKGALSEHRLFF